MHAWACQVNCVIYLEKFIFYYQVGMIENTYLVLLYS